MSLRLKSSASLQHLKKQAKVLLTAAHESSPEALSRFSRYYRLLNREKRDLTFGIPPAENASRPSRMLDNLKLADAQSVVAHENGYRDWTVLGQALSVENPNATLSPTDSAQDAQAISIALPSPPPPDYSKAYLCVEYVVVNYHDYHGNPNFDFGNAECPANNCCVVVAATLSLAEAKEWLESYDSNHGWFRVNTLIEYGNDAYRRGLKLARQRLVQGDIHRALAQAETDAVEADGKWSEARMTRYLSS